MSGAYSRNKGKRGELFVRDFLNDTLGFKLCKRGQQFKGSPDSPDVVGVKGLHVEAKFVEKLNIYDAVEQASQDAGKNTPAVFHKKNRKPLLITIKAEDLLRFCEIIQSQLCLDNDKAQSELNP